MPSSFSSASKRKALPSAAPSGRALDRPGGAGRAAGVIGDGVRLGHCWRAGSGAFSGRGRCVSSVRASAVRASAAFRPAASAMWRGHGSACGSGTRPECGRWGGASRRGYTPAQVVDVRRLFQSRTGRSPGESCSRWALEVGRNSVRVRVVRRRGRHGLSTKLRIPCGRAD